MSFEIERTELVWPGKYDKDGKRIEPPRVSLPFQVVERVNESRATRDKAKTTGLSLFEMWEGDHAETFEDGWRNKLIWGDNLLVMTSLLEQFAGKVDLIYIDPPFATGADFSISTEIGGDAVTVSKAQSAIEEKAYRDTWGRGNESFLSMMHDRALVMRDLLAEGGALYVHLDWRMSALIRAMLDSVFGPDSFQREIIWSFETVSGFKSITNNWIRAHETLLFYVKGAGTKTFNKQFLPHKPEYIARFDKVDSEGRAYRDDRTGGRKQYLDDSPGRPVGDVWNDIMSFQQASTSTEYLRYPTQKPETLLRRIIQASSQEGDLVCDVFSGSGTTLAVAEKLGRRWIGCDLGRFAIHTTRKRLLDVPDAKPLEVLNLGRYERRFWQVAEFGEDLDEDGATSLLEYIAFILKLYGARPYPGSEHVHGQLGKALVTVGPVDAPVTIQTIADAIEECVKLKAKELHVLGWEWEMGLHEPIVKEAKHRGIKLVLRQIPNEVMERQAADKGDVQFYELAYLDIEVTPGRGKRAYRVELKDFLIPNPDLVPDEVREQVSKWSDYVDYWAVDWNFSDDTFMHGWVAYRTRRDRSLALKSDSHSYAEPGGYRVMVKVIDIFGNDTSQLVEIVVK